MVPSEAVAAMVMIAPPSDSVCFDSVMKELASALARNLRLLGSEPSSRFAPSNWAFPTVWVIWRRID